MPADSGKTGCALNRKVIVGYATYGREQCAHCAEFIDSGSLLVALLATPDGTGGGALRPKWSHPTCFPAALAACRSNSFIQQHVPAVGLEKQCPGFVKLSATDKKSIQETFKKCLAGARDSLYAPERGRLVGSTTPFWDSLSRSAATSAGSGQVRPVRTPAVPVQGVGVEEHESSRPHTLAEQCRMFSDNTRSQIAGKKTVRTGSVGKAPGQVCTDNHHSEEHVSEQAEPMHVHVHSDGEPVAKAYIGKNEHGQPLVVNVHVHAAPTPSRKRPTCVDKITGREGAGNKAQKGSKAPPQQNVLSASEKKKVREVLKTHVRKAKTANTRAGVVDTEKPKAKKQATTVVKAMGKKARTKVAGQTLAKNVSKKGQATKSPRVQALRLSPSSKSKKQVPKTAVKPIASKRKHAKPARSKAPSKAKKVMKSAVKLGAKAQKTKSKRLQTLKCLSESKAKKKPSTLTRRSNTKKQKGVSKLVAKRANASLNAVMARKRANACILKIAAKARKSNRQQPPPLPNYLASIGKKKARDIVKVEISKALAEQRRMTKDIEKAALAKKLSEQRVCAARKRLARLQ